MSFAALVVLALGLAMDATAVAAARGACATRVRASDAVIVAMLFGGLHVVMPLVGSIGGLSARSLVELWDHWIAFALLVAIGAKMIWSARRGSRSDACESEPIGSFGLVTVALATSIDALAVGITLPLLGVSLVGAAVTIGGVTALACVGGLFVGHRFGVRIGRRLGAFGGLVLVAIGTKILVEHLASGR